MVREQIMQALEALSDAAVEHGAEPDEDGILDLDMLSDSADPVLKGIGDAASSLTEVLAELPADEEQEEPSESAEDDTPDED